MEDRNTIIMIFGALMHRPQLLAETDKYRLSLDDFDNRVDKYIYAAIQNLYENGAESITTLDITNYLSSNQSAYILFEKRNGKEMLQDAESWTNVDTFPYYYNRLKKFNLLRELKQQGIDTSEFYNENILDDNASQINAKFEELTIQDILDSVKLKLLHLENKYDTSEEVVISSAGLDLQDILEDSESHIDIGYPLQGEYFNEIVSGARKGTLLVRSGSSGLSKALPNSTIIPTPDGKKTVGEIKIGDYLFDAFGKPTKVLGVYPQGEKEVNYVRFEDGRTSLCCDEHLWSYCTSEQQEENKKNRQFFTKTLAEIKKEKLQDKNGNYRILIPVNYAVEYDKKAYCIPPYEVGLALGNDSVDRNKLSTLYIPESYFYGDIEQRYNLLNGLLDSAGFVTETGRVVYFTISSKLKDNVIELCHSLGFKTYVEVNKSKASDIEFVIDIVGRPQDIVKLFQLKSKKEILTKWYNTNTHQDSNEFNPIVEIVSCGYTEEMTCFYVDNDEHLFLTNDYIVTHNTRQAVADACFLAYPLKYDNMACSWVSQGNLKKVLFIATEQTAKEIQKMIIAYLSGLNESKLRYGNFTKSERKRIEKAIWLMEQYKENFYIIRMANPTIALIKNIIRENVMLHQIDAVFYDYIFIGPALLNEFKGFGLRNDELLLLMATALKDIAVECNVFVMTSTQVNANADNNQEIRNESSLAGSRAIINKADVGCIMARPSNEEIQFWKNQGSGYQMPNIVTDIYKVRSGKWTQVRIWSYFDAGTLEKIDLWVTDSRMNVISMDSEFKYLETYENEDQIKITQQLEYLLND